MKNPFITVYGILALVFASVPVHGQVFEYTESFTDEDAEGWEFVQDGTGTSNPGPRLTASTVPDPDDPEFGNSQLDTVGNGWLRLATTENNQSNAVALDVPIPSLANDVTVGFDFTMWGGGSDPADGITVFLWDAAVEFDPGAFGGSLGYAQRTGVNGLSGGYLGVGLDVYGNFSNDQEGRSKAYDGSDLPNSRDQNQIVLRGPDTSAAQDGSSGFEYIAGTGGKDYTAAGDPNIAGLDSVTQNLSFGDYGFRPDQDAEDYRYFELFLSSSNELTVRAAFGFGETLEDLFTVDVSEFDRPDQLRIGFAASTGGSLNVHEVRNLSISATASADSFYWDDEDGNSLWGTGLNWDKNTVPLNYATVLFTDQFPDTTTPQSVSIDGGDKIQRAMTFLGDTSYTITPSGSQKITLEFDDDGSDAGEKVYLSVLNSESGNASHTINADFDLGDEAVFQNLVDETLTLNGDINNLGNDLTIVSSGETVLNGILSGSGDLTKKESGTARLTGANTYSGATTIQEGILQIESNTALGTTAGKTEVVSGGTLGLANNIDVANGEDIDIAGTGQGGIGAIANISGNNTWRSDVDLTDDATIGSLAGTLTFTNDDEVNITGNDLTLNTAAGSQLEFDGTIVDSAGGGDVIKSGEGTAVFRNNNSYSGTTTINKGTLRLEDSGGLGNTSAGTVINDGATLELVDGIVISSAETFTTSGTGVSGKAAIWGSDGTSEVNGTVAMLDDTSFGAASGATLELDGTISGASDAIISGNGTVVWKAPMTYTGDTRIESGTLAFGDFGNRIADVSDVIISSGATLDMVNAAFDDTVGSLSGSGTVETGGATLTAGGNDNDTTWSGNISGNGYFVKEGSGEMIFDGANTFTGHLLVEDGIVTLGANNAFANNMDLILAGGTFATTGFADTMDNLILGSDSILDFRATTGGNLSFDDFLRDGGTLTINGWNGDINSGNGNTSLQISAATYAGFTNSLGVAGYDPSLDTDISEIFFEGWGAGANVLDLGGGIYEIVPSLEPFYIWDNDRGDEKWSDKRNWQTSTGSNPSNDPDAKDAKVLFSDLDPTLDGNTIQLRTDITVGTLVIDNDDTFTISSNNSGHDLDFDVSSGSAYLTALNSTSVTIDRRIRMRDDLIITNDSSSSAGLTLSATSNGKDLDTNGNTITVTGSGTTVINSKIIDGGDLVKSDDGVLKLTGTNTYSGGTTLNAGTLQIANNSALGTGTLTIEGGNLEADGFSRSISNTFVVNDDFGVTGSENLTLSGNGTISAGSQTVSVDGVTLTASGTLSGSGELVKDGTGTLVINNASNSFSGGFVQEAGTTTVTGSSNFNIGGGNSYLGTGDLTLNGGSLNATISGNVDLNVAAGATVNIAGGTHSIELTNSGSDALINGDINVTGGDTTVTIGDDFVVDQGNFSIDGGTLTINAGDTFNTDTTSNANLFEITNGGQLNIDLSGNNTGDFTLGEEDTIRLNGSGSNLEITPHNNVRLDGVVRMEDESTITVNGGTTFLSSTTRFESSTTNKGTLVLNEGSLSVDEPLVAGAPNITFDNDTNQQITAPNSGSSILNLGTITKEGTGTLTVNSNINNIQATVVVNGGTFLLGDSDQLDNSTDMTLGGGTFATGGNDEILSTLTLSTDSTIDMGSGDSILQYTSGGFYEDGTLTIDNWSGSNNGGGTDQIIFGTGLSQEFLDNVYWSGTGIMGARQLVTGEIVPTPEPATYVTASLLLITVVVFEVRRRRKRT